MKNRTDIIVVGGGVIGLSCAYALTQRGVNVTLLNSSRPGTASPVAAGMLAPLAEARHPGPFVDAGLVSLGRWPSFAEHLREDSGIPIHVYGPGMLRLARTEQEEQLLCSALNWQQKLGLPLHWLTGAEARQLEPGLSCEALGGLLSPDERVVEPLLLHKALTEACARLGTTILPATAVTGFACEGQRVTAVNTESGSYAAERYLIAGGAWTGLLGKLLPASVPVTPLRGQIITLRPSTPIALCHTLYVHGGYVVPRPDGRVVSGATEDNAGFKVNVHPDDTKRLLESVCGLIPALSGAYVYPAQVGLRPVSPDSLPILGPLPGWENVHVAAGHGRNGILLTPLTGAWMSGALLDNMPLPAAFSPARFAEDVPCR